MEHDNIIRVGVKIIQEIFNKKVNFDININIIFIQIINLIELKERQHCSILKKIETEFNQTYIFELN